MVVKTILKRIISSFFLDFYHQFWPFFGALVYRFPAKKLKVIGITGTNGKTTVTHLATAILEAAGYKVASISSLRFKIGGREWKNELKMTMPGRMKIQKFLRDAVNEKCDYAVLEVTSEGIKQRRHTFIDFDVAVFTNLTPEHIERHGGFENYKKAKGELFKRAKTCIINLDDASAEYFSNLCKGKNYEYSIKSNDLHIISSLPGEFNLYNALAAAYVGVSQGVDIKVIKSALENIQSIPGRMELVLQEPFHVIVDYAHTPDALEKVYKTLRETYNTKHNTSLICVLGACGGGRDKWKRPVMGEIAERYCDSVVLTDEDPYEESSQKILDDIEKGMKGSKFHASGFIKVLDRRQAIKKALEIAKAKDTVIITGKGAEPWLMTNNGKISWDDREVVKEEIARLMP